VATWLRLRRLWQAAALRGNHWTVIAGLHAYLRSCLSKIHKTYFLQSRNVVFMEEGALLSRFAIL
jgi:hypothetical protein